MEIRLLTSSEDLRAYDSWVRAHPEGSLWQSLEWKTYQEALGRNVKIYATMEGQEIVASALVVIDRTSFGLSTWEVPRGPLLSEKIKEKREKLLEKIIEDAKKEHCLSLYLSPPTTDFFSVHFSLFSSNRLVMPTATRLINLNLSEDELLAQMKPKGRYNIKLAEKHGVRIVQSDDVTAYAALAKQTWKRDDFRGPKSGYTHFLKDLPGSFLLLASPADRPDEPVAGLLGAIWRSTGLYYYGASSDHHRELMAPYLLQWEAMKLCKARGCPSYDLFGIAPEGVMNHPWAGVSDFKTKFGGTVMSYPPEQEITLRPRMKSLLKIKRKIFG